MKIKVSNILEVTNPTQELQAWCKSHLILDNPDFYKKQRMGFSTYNTPKQLQLYEVRGDTYRLPFGCIDILWKRYRRDIKFENDIQPVRTFNYHSGINLYPYQQKAVNEALKVKNGIIVMPCGSGKTQTALQIIAKLGFKALWLTHTQDLLNQSKERAKSVFDCDGYGTITAGKVNIGSGLTFATVQTMAKLDLPQYKDEWGVVVVDECMPGDVLIDTPVGKKELKNLHIDDIITSYNRNEEKIENKRIAHIFKNNAHDIVKVKLSNGEEIICTKNHPIYTRSGQWVDAERLVCDDYVLRLVWERSGDECNAENVKAQSIGERLLLLFQGMLNKRWSQERCVDRRAQKKGVRNYGENKRKISRTVCKAYDNEQSHEECRNKRKGFKAFKRNRTSSKNKVWERYGTYCSSTNTNACACGENGSVCRISCTDQNGKRFRLSDLLQSRYSNSGRNDCNRSGWCFTLCGKQTRAGQEERGVFEWIRVDSVEVQEQTSDGTFGGMCSDGFVYNIEVEDNNNYFANGILVHNCQHCAGSATKVTQFYKVINNLSARYKIGLTATPHRADGLTDSMFALLGNTIHTVSKEEVADTTCPVIVEPIPTEYAPADIIDVLKTDGTLDFQKLIADLISNDVRFLKIMHEINSRQGAMIVLANRVEYLKRMMSVYEGKAVCLSGMSASKQSKAIRKKALADLQNGEIDCIFATYSLASEGLDCPGLRYVVFATPEKDERIITQSVGRVARKCEGKEYGTVIDFVDDFGIYKGYWKKRKKIYWKLDCEVKEYD